MCHLIIDRSMGGDLSIPIIYHGLELGVEMTPADRDALLRVEQGEWNEDDHERLYWWSLEIIEKMYEKTGGESVYYVEDNCLWACEDPEGCPGWRAGA